MIFNGEGGCYDWIRSWLLIILYGLIEQTDFMQRKELQLQVHLEEFQLVHLLRALALWTGNINI